MPCLDNQEQAEYDTHQRTRPRRPAGFDDTPDKGVEDMPCTDYVADAQYEQERWAKLSSERDFLHETLMGIFAEHPVVLTTQSKKVRRWVALMQKQADRHAAAVAKEKEYELAKKAAKKKLQAALTPAQIKILGVDLGDEDDL